MNRSTFNIRGSFLYITAALLLGSSVFSCGDGNSIDTEEPRMSSLSMQMRSTKGAEIFAANTNIYMFDPNNLFVEKKLNVTYVDNTLYTNIEVGDWNFVLLACDHDITGNTLVPVPNSPMEDTPMWQTKTETRADEEFLSQTPAELRYASLPDITIEEDKIKQVSTLLYRNVAKVQVILKYYDGFDEITDANRHMAYAELLAVPTTLAWDGKLYPNGDSPRVSEKPMRENFAFNDNGVADTLNFIVPAHRGSDAFIPHPEKILVRNPADTDTTTHKLTLRVSMPLGNKEYFGRSKDGIEIPYVPKVNGIIQINVTFYGKTSLDIKIGVKEWEDWITQDEAFN